MVELNTIVTQIVEDIEALEGGPRMSMERLHHWADRLVLDTNNESEIFEQLLAIAKKFEEAGGPIAAQQLTLLATIGVHHIRQNTSVKRNTGEHEQMLGTASGDQVKSGPGLGSPSTKGFSLRGAAVKNTKKI